MEQIRLDGIIGWDVTAGNLRSQLPKNKEDPVNIYVNSKGGDPFEGFAIYQLLSEYNDVTVELGGIVASAASIFPLAANKIIANKTSTWMGHKAWTIAIGNADDFTKEVNILSGIDGLIAEAYAQSTGKTQEEMLTAMSDEIWLFGGDAIKDFGIATEIKDDEEAKDINESAVRSMIYSALKTYENSKKGTDHPDVNPKADLSAERERTIKILASAGIKDENTVSAIVNGDTPESFKPANKVTPEFVGKKLTEVKDEFKTVIKNEISLALGRI